MEYLLILNAIIFLFWSVVIAGDGWPGLIAKILMVLFAAMNTFACLDFIGYIVKAVE